MDQPEDELRLAIEHIPGLVWSGGPDGAGVFFSKAWLAYTGLSYEEALGWGWVKSLHPDDLQRAVLTWQSVIETKEAGEQVARWRRADGEYRHVLFTAAPRKGENGEIIRWYGLNFDIEDRRRSDEALKKARTALERASRITTMGEFAASLAHEISQPLMAVTTDAATCLSWLAKSPPDLFEAAAAAERALRGGHRAGEIVRSIRALAKKAEPTVTTFILNEAVAETLEVFRDDLQQRRILVRLTSHPERISISADRTQLQQVFINLVRNAIESQSDVNDRETFVNIELRLENGLVEAAVSDNGVGFEPRFQERMFEPFFSDKHQGIGLGLSICRSIIDAHRGQLRATARRPYGSVFSFTLPGP